MAAKKQAAKAAADKKKRVKTARCKIDNAESVTERRLTPKQENFCLEVVKGASLSDAYRAAYSTEGMKSETINARACELSKDSKITVRIKELQDRAANEAVVTLSGHLKRLEELCSMAAEKGQMGAAINAEIARGKVSGLYVDRQQIEASVSAAEPVRVVFEYPDNGRLAAEGTD